MDLKRNPCIYLWASLICMSLKSANADSPFYPSLSEKCSRLNPALKLSIAEVHLQGIGTRKISKVLLEFCSIEVSSSQFSALTARLDPQLKQWREHPLPLFPI